jgi:hypothetical protein
MLNSVVRYADMVSMNKRFLYCLLVCLTVAGIPAFAAKAAVPVDVDNSEYDNLALSIDGVTRPFVKGNYAIFTADKHARFVGIAFDFENFRTIHSFKLRTIRDAEYKAVDSFYFYILDLPKTVQSVRYRLVVDGLWTTDPLNDTTVYNEDTGITLSELDASRYIPPVTEEQQKGIVHFVYQGESGEEIRLGGNFTNWDSWIYELTEVQPGLYQLDLPLPPGKYEYAFYKGLTTLVDKSNPDRCYTPDGKEASLLVVK